MEVGMDESVGVIGGGQLARMMIPAAIELGVPISVLAETEGMAASIAATAVGDYTDVETVRRFASGVDVVTFDHEHVPAVVLRALEAEGVVFRPGSAALHFAQDKLAMRRKMVELGLPQPAWAAVRTAAELEGFLSAHGGKAVLKLPVGGYDGHGVRFIGSAADAADWLTPSALEAFPDGLLVEEAVSFSRELSQLSARSASGEFSAWVLTETVQKNGVCTEAIAPAPRSDPRLRGLALDVAEAIARELDVTGVLAVELFETDDRRLLINELAMRPHNTGHWTMDGAVTGQFEQHIRAVLGLPLGDTSLRGKAAAMINVLGGPKTEDLSRERAAALADQPSAKLHLYGKSWRPGRKVGHVTVVSNSPDDPVADAVYRARAVAGILETEA